MVILLGVSLFVGILFLIAFIWSVKSGQFEDDYSPAHKILFEPQIKQQDEDYQHNQTKTNH